MIFRQEKQKRKERIQIIMTTVAAGRSKTYDLVYIAVFAVVMAVCSWISIPAQVPFTLQTFGVFMAVGVLGGKRGTLAVLVYVLLGAVGVPVFAGFSGGIGALLGNAGGYIIGFIFSALVMWAIEHIFGRNAGCSDHFHDRWTDRMLCLWNRMVYVCLHKKHRSGRSYGSSWLVCVPVYHSGSY